MYALYGSEPQFGASGGIFFSCGSTTYYKLISKNRQEPHRTNWPESIQTHTNEVIGISVTAASTSDVLQGRLGFLTDTIPPDVRTSLQEADGKIQPHLIASISRHEFRLSVVIPSLAEDEKLAYLKEIAVHKLNNDDERFMSLSSSQGKLVLMVLRRCGEEILATSALLVTDVYKLQSSSVLSDWIMGKALINFGTDCIPVASQMRKNVFGMILSRGERLDTGLSPTKLKSKMRKNRQQSVLYIDLAQQTRTLAALIKSETLSQVQRDLTAISVDGLSLCLAEQGGALHWWSLPPLNSIHEIDAESTQEDLSTISTDNRIRVHWHNATLSTVKLVSGLTYAGGEQSRLVGWNLESGFQRNHNIPISDGCIINVQVSEDNMETRVMVTTSTNKIYVINMALSDSTTFTPLVIGPAIPVIYPAKFVEVRTLSHLSKETSLTNFLEANMGRLETFKGFHSGKVQISILAFHQSPARVCAHDGDFRLKIVDSTDTPFSSMILRSHRKHSWSRPESLDSGTAHALYTGAHSIAAVTALPEHNLIITATTFGSKSDRVNLLELYQIEKLKQYPHYQMKSLCQITLAKAPVALEALSQNSSIIIAFEDGQLHFSRLDRITEQVKPVSEFFGQDSFSLQSVRVIQRQKICEKLTYKNWRNGVREQVLADYKTSLC